MFYENKGIVILAQFFDVKIVISINSQKFYKFGMLKPLNIYEKNYKS